MSKWWLNGHYLCRHSTWLKRPVGLLYVSTEVREEWCRLEDAYSPVTDNGSLPTRLGYGITSCILTNEYRLNGVHNCYAPFAAVCTQYCKYIDIHSFSSVSTCSWTADCRGCNSTVSSLTLATSSAWYDEDGCCLVSVTLLGAVAVLGRRETKWQQIWTREKPFCWDVRLTSALTFTQHTCSVLDDNMIPWLWPYQVT